MADVKLRITKKNGTTYDISNATGLKSIESLSQDTANLEGIDYNILPNSGSAEIIDVNGNILKSIENGTFEKSGLPAEIIINGNTIQKHIIKTSKYDTISQTLSIEMNDVLSQWDEIDYNGHTLIDSTSAYSLLSDVFESAGYTTAQIDSMLSENVIYGQNNTEGTIKQYLQSITIPYPYLEPAKLRQTIEKFCTLAQLRVSLNDSGQIKFYSARPLLLGSELNNHIVIESKNQLTQPSEDVLLDNKITSVGYTDLSTDYSYKEVYSSNITFLKQTQNGKLFQSSVDGSNIYAYSGTYSDYEQNLTVSDNGTQLYGIYPIYRNGAISTEERYALFKASFEINEITKGNQWFVNLSNYEANVLPLLARPQSSSSYFLFHDTYSNNIVGSFQPDVVYPYEYVTSEAQALTNLCHYSGGNIDAIIYNTTSLPKIQIVKNDNKYTIYYITTVSVNDDKTDPDNYTGDLQQIILGGKLSIYLRCLSTTSKKVDENSEYIIDTNELMQNTATISGNNLIQYIKNNILTDYSNGISNISLSISCGDFYNEQDTLVKDYVQGQIISKRDIVKLASNNPRVNNKSGRVLERKFRKLGVPILDIKLQEMLIPHSVQFYIDGSLSSTQTVYNKASNPSSTINYWFTDSGLTQVFDFDTIITEDLILYGTTQKTGQLVLTTQNCSISVERTASASAGATLKVLQNGDIVFAGDTLKYTITRSSGDATLYSVSNDNIQEQYIVTTSNPYIGTVNFSLVSFEGDVNISAKSGTWTRLKSISIPFQQNDTSTNYESVSTLEEGSPVKISGRIEYNEYSSGGGASETRIGNIEGIVPFTWTSIDEHISVDFSVSGKVITIITTADNQAYSLSDLGVYVYQIQ